MKFKKVENSPLRAFTDFDIVCNVTAYCGLFHTVRDNWVAAELRKN